MGLYDIFDISGSAMSAQSIRLNTTASNIANADSVASSSGETYKARHPVFQAVMNGIAAQGQNGNASAGVSVAGIVESQAAPIARYQPENPLADEQGFVYAPNINIVEEMANMISASRSYQSNVQVATMTKHLLTRTLTLGQ
ncbi:flagellar basal body rod protein FlgC [Aliikangiella coralliicola]|uniref:Flagellar basal-body rod protein FlgC n=1 Tax=Aliikangiella coralliicola TaxID=2592383 RepID=A0A545U5X7_9GAMM|nr:flagellar basal body rod protein FlgC [Aliikangiella coralliicola]TQV84872.1 flagellar basal body rod protein FlgC [Aliikangiella coralliicola]